MAEEVVVAVVVGVVAGDLPLPLHLLDLLDLEAQVPLPLGTLAQVPPLGLLGPLVTLVTETQVPFSFHSVARAPLPLDLKAQVLPLGNSRSFVLTIFHKQCQ